MNKYTRSANARCAMTGLPGRQRGRGQRVTVRQPPEPGDRGHRLKAMMDIAIRAAARPGQRRWSPPWTLTTWTASSRRSPSARRPSGRSMRTPAPGSQCSSRSWLSRASAGRTRRASPARSQAIRHTDSLRCAGPASTARGRSCRRADTSAASSRATRGKVVVRREALRCIPGVAGKDWRDVLGSDVLPGAERLRG